MNPVKKNKVDELRPEYRREDLATGVRGKYLDVFRDGTNLVLLNADLAKAFPTEDSVNKALRSLMEVAERSAS
jgi:hypothetical protein